MISPPVWYKVRVEKGGGVGYRGGGGGVACHGGGGGGGRVGCILVEGTGGEGDHFLVGSGVGGGWG